MTKQGAADPRPPLVADTRDAALVERRESGEQVYRGKLLDVRRDRARMPDGSFAVREYIVHPGAVLVVPVHRRSSRSVPRRARSAAAPRDAWLFTAPVLMPSASAISTSDRSR